MPSHQSYTREEMIQRGQAFYDQQIRPTVEAEHKGQFLILDIETGEYEVDVTAPTAEACGLLRVEPDRVPPHSDCVREAMKHAFGVECFTWATGSAHNRLHSVLKELCSDDKRRGCGCQDHSFALIPRLKIVGFLAHVS